MRYRDYKPADLDRARAAVAQWRTQNSAGTEEQLTAALGPQFHPDYGPVLRAVLFTHDRHHPPTSQEQPGQQASGAGNQHGSRLCSPPPPRKAAPDMTTGPGPPADPS